MKITLFLLYTLVAIVISVSVLGACIDATENLTISGNTEICAKQYNLSDYDGNGAIMPVGSSNIYLWTTGAYLNGTNASGSKGIAAENGLYRSNVSTLGFIIKDYVTACIIFGKINIFNVSNNTLQNCRDWGLYMGDVSNGTITRNYISNVAGGSSDGHGIYISSNGNLTRNNTEKINITFNTIINTQGQGIYFNNNNRSFTRNILISNNYINNIGTAGIWINNLYDSIIKDNVIANCSNEGIRLSLDTGANANAVGNYNVTITNNTIYRNTQGSILIAKSGRMINIKDNIYPDGTAIFRLRTNSTHSVYDIPNVTFNESVQKVELTYDAAFQSEFGSANITWNYVGRKYFNVYNNTISGLVAPYDDIVNASNGLLLCSHCSNYTFRSNYKLLVGRYNVSDVSENQTLMIYPFTDANYYRWLPVSWLENTSEFVWYTNVTLLNYSNSSIVQWQLFTNYTNITGGGSYAWSYDYDYLAVNKSVNNSFIYSVRFDGVVTGYFGNVSANFVYSDNSSYLANLSFQSYPDATTYDVLNPLFYKHVSFVEFRLRHSGPDGAVSASDVRVMEFVRNTSLLFDTYLYNLTPGLFFVNVSIFNESNRLDAFNFSGLFNIATNAYINVSAINNFEDSPIQTFTAYLYDLGSADSFYGSTVDGLLVLDFVKGSAYNLTLNSSSFVNTSAYFSTNSSYNNITLYMDKSNSITFNIFNNLGISLDNYVNVFLYGATHYFNYSVLNTLYVFGIPTDVYNILFTNTNFSDKYYTLYMVDGSATTINVYMESGTSVVFNVYDVNGAKLSNVLVEQSKFINSSLKVMASKLTDFNGQVSMIINGTSQYCFSFTKTGFLDVYQCLNPVSAASYDIFMATDYSTVSYSPVAVSGRSLFDPNTNILSFYYTSSDATLNNYSYTVSQLQNENFTILCTEHSLALSNIFYCNLTNYYGQVYVQGVANDLNIFYGEYVKINSAESLVNHMSLGDAGLMGFLIASVMVFFGLLFGPIGTLITGVVGVLVISWLQLLSLLTGAIIIIDCVVVLVIILGMKRR